MNGVERRERVRFGALAALLVVLCIAAAYGVVRDDGRPVLLWSLGGICLCLLVAGWWLGDWLTGRRRGLTLLAAVAASLVVVLVGVGAYALWPAPRNAGWAAHGEGKHVRIDDTVVGVDERGAGAHLVGHRAEDGMPLWRHRLPGLGGNGTMQLYAAGGRVLVAGYERTVAFAPDGTRRWTATTSGAPVAIDGDTVVYDTPARGVDLDTGQERWVHDDLEDTTLAQRPAGVFGEAPAVAPSATSVLAQVRGRTTLVLVDTETGERRTLPELRALDGAVVARGWLVRSQVLDIDGETYALRLTGTPLRGTDGERWSRVVDKQVRSTVVGLVDATLRLLARRGGRDTLVRIDPRTGETAARPVPRGRQILGDYTSYGVADEPRLALRSGDGSVVVWDPDSGKQVRLHSGAPDGGGAGSEPGATSAGSYSAFCTDAGYEVVGPHGYHEGPFRDDGCGTLSTGVATVGDRVLVLPEN